MKKVSLCRLGREEKEDGKHPKNVNDCEFVEGTVEKLRHRIALENYFGG